MIASDAYELCERLRIPQSKEKPRRSGAKVYPEGALMEASPTFQLPYRFKVANPGNVRRAMRSTHRAFETKLGHWQNQTRTKASELGRPVPARQIANTVHGGPRRSGQWHLSFPKIHRSAGVSQLFWVCGRGGVSADMIQMLK
jgi:hypothetical protein